MMIKKLIAVLFMTMMFTSLAQAGFSSQDMVNIELDGNMGASEC